MFSLPSPMSIFVHRQPTAMRKSFDGLAAIVSNAFSRDLFAGDGFVRRKRGRGSFRYSRALRSSAVWPEGRVQSSGFRGFLDPCFVTERASTLYALRSTQVCTAASSCSFGI
jgi:hypothetical protein